MSSNKGRIRLRRLLSSSLPDVSGGGRRGQQLTNPPAATPLLLPPVPSKTPSVQYNIDDDAWADSVDPVTGSVFFVDTPPAPRHEDSPLPRSSSSCSSISSSPSISDLPLHPHGSPSLPPLHPHGSPSLPPLHLHGSPILPPHGSPILPPHGSPILPPHRSPSLSERRTQSMSVHINGAPSPSPDHHSVSSASLGQTKTSSLLKRRWRKAMHFRAKSVSEIGVSPSGSFPADLNDIDLIHHSRKGYSLDSPTPPPSPHGTLYGSHGIPLHHHDTTRTSIISVRININQYKLGTKDNPCSLETLGIVPTRTLGRSRFGSLASLRFSFKSQYPPLPPLSHPVVIRGVVPASPAAVTQQLHQGDTILCLNGLSVDLETIDTILSSLSDEVVFLVRKPQHVAIPPAHHRSGSGLAKLVTGKQGSIQTLTRRLMKYPHIALYLTLDTKEEDPAEKDIIYRYPVGNSWCVDTLVHLRGLFLTLSDMMGSIIAGATSSCSTILLDHQLVHLGYVQYGKEMLLLALPARVASQYQVQLLVESVERTLQLLYNSVHRAFTGTDNHSSLNQLFSLIFERILCPSDPRNSCCVLSGAPQLKLPSDTKVKLSAALSELDSADHSNRPEILHLRRPFLLTGSCLFYKGSLACSHLSDGELCDVVGFCDVYRLLELTASESVNQIIIWKEVYLSSRRDTPDQSHPVYQEGKGKRSFLLVVGLEHLLLCMLMEHSPQMRGTQTPPTVDAVYIDRARALIMDLGSGDLLTECEESCRGLLSTPVPSISSADVALAALFTSSSRQHRKLSQQTSIERESDSDEAINQFPYGSSKPVKSLLRASFKPRRRSREHSLPILNHHGATTFATARLGYMLTAGLESILFHYLALDTGRGVMIWPTHAMPPGAVQAELLQCFHRTCLAVREVLKGGGEDESSEDSDDSEEDEKQNEKKASGSPFTAVMGPVIEHGVMMKCSVQGAAGDRHKVLPTLRYWVVGRVFTDSDTELYVCYQDNTSQNTVEIAFRLLFGSPG